MRTTILTELGRLEEPSEIRHYAQIICDNKMPAREATVRLRRLRLGMPRGSVSGLIHQLSKVIDDYWFRHPEMTTDEIKQSVVDAYELIGVGRPT